MLLPNDELYRLEDPPRNGLGRVLDHVDHGLVVGAQQDVHGHNDNITVSDDCVYGHLTKRRPAGTFRWITALRPGSRALRRSSIDFRDGTQTHVHAGLLPAHDRRMLRQSP